MQPAAGRRNGAHAAVRWCRRAVAAAVAGVALGAGPGWAARPMATDDTSTAGSGTCQAEAWTERVDASRSVTLAPACGLTEELELDSSFSRVAGQSLPLSAAAAGLKWVPEAASFETALGRVRLGGIAFGAWARDAARGWRGDYVALVGLASLTPVPELNLYVNAFVTHSLDRGPKLGGARAAIAWQPGDRWLLFVEGLTASDATRSVNAGLRYWLQPDVLGLDVVGSRPKAGGQSFGASVGVGIGWYGLRLF